jgi:hypothetical protein
VRRRSIAAGALLVAAAVASAARSGGDRPTAAPPIEVGVPVAHALRAANPGGGSGLLLSAVFRRGLHRRDVCLRLALERQNPAEADVHCVVRDPGGGVVELWATKGVPEALGPAVSVVAGHAGRRVRKLVLEAGPESRELPLSTGRDFLALLPASYRGSVALVARNADGTVARLAFALPPPPETHPRYRRPGAVFAGDIGEDVIGDRRPDLLRRLGAPAAHHGSCLYYEVVGGVPSAWVLCLEGGRVARAFARYGAGSGGRERP